MHTPTRLVTVALAATLGVAALSARQQTAPVPPPWAFTVNAPPASPATAIGPAKADAAPRRVSGSTATFTPAQLRDVFNPPDWHPDGHPTMPNAVAHGRAPNPRACGYCHLPNGQGRPENASLAGLPADYVAQQMADFKSGARKTSEPRMGPPNAMIADAVAATAGEVEEAAAYFASFPFKPWIRVVEAATVPRTRVAGWMHVADNGAGTDPLGQRILEMSEDQARTELRDDASGFVAYVPVGSIAAGEVLVTTGGNGRTVACGTCHGKDLKGLGPVPPLAGRSPSYTVRQLFDMKHGARKGPWSALMAEAVRQLTEADMIAIAAYTASRTP